MKALFLGWEFGDGLIASHETCMIRGSCGSKCPFHAHTPQFHSWLEKSLPQSLLRFRPLSTDGHVFFSSTGVCHVQIRRRRCANQHHTACAESGGAGGLWLEVWQLQTSSIAKSYWKQVTTESQQKKWYKKTIENGKNYIVGLVLEQWRDPLRIFWVITGVRNELVLTPNVPIRHHGPL